MYILAIETSCDETAAAVLEVSRGRFNLLSNIVSSQIKIHAKYGGIVPEVAARKQMEMIIPVIEKACQMSNVKCQMLDYIAVTQGPGLITSLTVGVETAKSLAFALNKPLIAVNHLAGHLLVNYLNIQTAFRWSGKSKTAKYPIDPPKGSMKYPIYPAVGLIVSGGHTMLVLMSSPTKFKIIGATVDDAVGEAYDKVAKILNLGYPGGPVISKLSLKGNPNKFNLPRPMISQNNFNFSFSGLKTAVLYLTQKHKNIKAKKHLLDICASFDQACVDVLTSKTLRAIKKYKPRSFLLGGGVAANPKLRTELKEKISRKFPDIKIFIPDLKFTGDNAAMIAVAAYFIIKTQKTKKSRRKVGIPIKASGHKNTLNLKADPTLTL